uniref:Uncharacterized protein n=1 Tax=Romanomermis culicivorax TaxID=13658 RepID=A0A915JTD8_ROMCU
MSFDLETDARLTDAVLGKRHLAGKQPRFNPTENLGEIIKNRVERLKHLKLKALDFGEISPALKREILNIVEFCQWSYEYFGSDGTAYATEDANDAHGVKWDYFIFISSLKTLNINMVRQQKVTTAFGNQNSNLRPIDLNKKCIDEQKNRFDLIRKVHKVEKFIL